MARIAETKPRRDRKVTPAEAILAWYDRHRRQLPWRYDPGVNADPYIVWLSEIMLQQTTVAAVIPYFGRFVARWPSVSALAAAPLDDVLTAWAGLGYYARARNLHRCAEDVAFRRGGEFPRTETELRELPGVGPYTAAAIAAIAFGHRAVVVDGNVERVMARLFGVTEQLPAAKEKLRRLADHLTPNERAGDYAQAVMDLGATVCTPKSPACGTCVWADRCVAKADGNATTLPRRAAKSATPTRRGIAYWLVRSDGAVLLRRRPAKGLLGGMLEIPSTPWRAGPARRQPQDAFSEREAAAVSQLDWTPIPGQVEHTFTHFRLFLEVTRASITAAAAKRLTAEDHVWVRPGEFPNRALPNVMLKVAKHVLGSPLKRANIVPRRGSAIR